MRRLCGRQGSRARGLVSGKHGRPATGGCRRSCDHRPSRSCACRRTFVSLALANGADRESVKWIAHGRPTDVLGMYTESDWRRLCDAMLCVRVRQRRAAAVATVREANKHRGRVKRPAGENGKELLPSTPVAAKGS